MKNLLFDSFRQWRVCLWSGVCKACWGLFRIVTCFLFGIMSIFAYCFKQIGNFCKREFLASFIIGFVISIMAIGWLATFVSERKHRVDAEMQRDRLRYELDSAKQLIPHKIVNDDTE